MRNTHAGFIPLPLITGAALMFLAVPLIAWTSAIAAPPGFFQWFTSSPGKQWASLIWDMLVVFGATVTLPVTLASAALMRLLPLRAFLVPMMVALGALVAVHLLIPAWFGEPIIRPLSWWSSALEYSIILGSIVGFGLGRRSSARQKPVH